MTLWTAVSDGLPDDDMSVLIATTNDDVWIGWHDGDNGWIDATTGGSIEVTHWMDIPDHPTAPK